VISFRGSKSSTYVLFRHSMEVRGQLRTPSFLLPERACRRSGPPTHSLCGRDGDGSQRKSLTASAESRRVINLERRKHHLHCAAERRPFKLT
jgi:hypothetical protein